MGTHVIGIDFALDDLFQVLVPGTVVYQKGGAIQYLQNPHSLVLLMPRYRVHKDFVLGTIQWRLKAGNSPQGIHEMR